MRTRVVIVGGFLGAGKTTLLLQAAKRLSVQDLKVGIVTNDQGQNLVDTALVSNASFPVREVSRGCFCCNFPDLIQALTRLQDEVAPDVILAEPVGSCTDLVATTLRPLAIYHAEQFWVAPLTILIDPMRDLSAFPNEVDYLYQKQLAEAAVILLNKCDVLSIETRQTRLAEMAQAFPTAQAIEISALTGMGVPKWLELVLQEANTTTDTLTLDYQIYAQAEAALGWLNAAGRVNADAEFSILDWTTKLLEGIGAGCAQAGLAVAHVKVQVNAGALVCKASIIGDDSSVEWSLRTPDMPIMQLEFLINARISASPAMLEKIVMAAVEEARPGAKARYYFTQFECFSPQPPRPTYRITSPSPA